MIGAARVFRVGGACQRQSGLPAFMGEIRNGGRGEIRKCAGGGGESEVFVLILFI